MENKSSNRNQNHDLSHNQTSALFAAALNGHTECVELLLSSGSPADVSDENGFTPLHFAAAHGHSSCVEVLLIAGAAVDAVAVGGQTSLFLACEAGRLDCAQILLSAGADRSLTTADKCTTLHAAVRSGHMDLLRLLLCHPSPGDPTVAPATLALPAALLNQANNDGWTAAHMAAALGLKECLEVLCSHSEQDIERRDKCNRTIHDVATDDCKDLLENLKLYQVQVYLQYSGVGTGSMCPIEALEEEVGKRLSNSHLVLGRVSVDRSTCWTQLSAALGHIFTSHLQILCGESQMAREEVQRPPLGLSSASIASILIGDTEWLPGQELPVSPWDLVRKPLSQSITIRLKGLSESSLDELALESLFPLPLLHNYVRLVEQYGNLIFHGLQGSCQEYIAGLVARCIKSKQKAGGLSCDVVRVEVEESLTKEHLLETFINCGFLVPVGSGVRLPTQHTNHCVVVLLEGLEKASSLTGLLGDLCDSLDSRSIASSLVLNTGPHHFRQGSFLIATLSKPRLQGAELCLQQHFRWVTFRWDQEPLHGLLGRHLRRKLLHKIGTGVWSPDGVMERLVLWVSQVWQQLNACLSRLGTHEALLGPQLFLSCPVVPNNTQATVRWLARLWNAVVVPCVEEAIISRVTTKRSSSTPHSSAPLSQRRSLSNCGLSAGQQAVVKAALSILVNKAVLPGCPLPRHEIDRYLLEFRGGTFPLSAVGPYKGSVGGGGGRRGRDSGKLRRSNTSPRKKGTPALNWSSGSFREGSLSTSDVSFISNGKVQREPGGPSVFSDDETDLIRELQTMCSSKSEPDITKISHAKDDLILFSSLPSEARPPPKAEQETAVQQQPQIERTVSQSSRGSNQAAVQSSDRRSGPRVKSQLPIASSRGQQTRVSTAASSSSNNNNGSNSPSRVQTAPSRSRTTSSSTNGRTKQAPLSSSSSNNYYRNINNNNQSHEEIWILHRDLHENK